MILNVESSPDSKNVKLGPFSIDYGLQCLTVVDNNNRLIKAIDLRKFKVINEFKVTQQVDGFEEESGFIYIVSG